MTLWQRDFWRAWLAWWLDGCPEPRMWWSVRIFAEGCDRLARVMGSALLPTIQKAAEALAAFTKAYTA